MSRIPSTLSNPDEYKVNSESISYYTFNGQITRVYKHLEVYLGAENILNYIQDSPIIAANNPNGEYFDASLIWGPVVGRNIYFGFRYKIK